MLWTEGRGLKNAPREMIQHRISARELLRKTRAHNTRSALEISSLRRNFLRRPSIFFLRGSNLRFALRWGGGKGTGGAGAG